MHPNQSPTLIELDCEEAFTQCPPQEQQRLHDALARVRAEVVVEDLRMLHGEIPTPAEKQPLDAAFLELPERLLLGYRNHGATSELGRLLQSAERLRERVDRVVLLGIGGSYMGPRALLDALCEFEGVGLIFTYPNADAGHKIIIEEIGKFVSDHPDSIFVKALGREKYFSCINCCDGVIGNSSSGLSEVPSFKKGTVNIGDRQKGREKAASVIDCESNKDAISRAIRELLSPIFQQQLVNVNNPYGKSGASLKVKQILVNYPLERLVKKSFFDINASI